MLFNRVLGSPAYPVEETELRDKAARAFDRAFDPQGVARQLAAAMTTPDRTEDLRRIDLPTLVIHGAEDTLIAVSGGQATAEAIPGAELVVIDGMGHDLPRPLWPTVAERIAALVARAEQQPAKHKHLAGLRDTATATPTGSKLAAAYFSRPLPCHRSRNRRATGPAHLSI